MSELKWRKRMESDASIGYVAEGERHRYIACRTRRARGDFFCARA